MQFTLARLGWLALSCALIAQAAADITSFKLPKAKMVVGERVQLGWEFTDKSGAQSSVLQINIVPQGGDFATDTIEDLTVDQHAKRYAWLVDVPPNKYYLHALGADSDSFEVVENSTSSDEDTNNSTNTATATNGSDTNTGTSKPNSPQDNPQTSDSKANDNSALIAGIVVVAAVAVCGLGIAGYLAFRRRDDQNRLIADILAAREAGFAKAAGSSPINRNTADGESKVEHPQTGQPLFGSR